MMETENKKLCLYCEKPIEGRRDKKYCDPNCRALFHQERKQKEEAHFFKVLNILKNNRKILLALNPAGYSTVRKSFLQARGYNFNYFTNIFKTGGKEVYYFCFDVGIKEVKDKPYKVTVVNWQKYMETYKLPLGRFS